MGMFDEVKGQLKRLQEGMDRLQRRVEAGEAGTCRNFEGTGPSFAREIPPHQPPSTSTTFSSSQAPSIHPIIISNPPNPSQPTKKVLSYVEAARSLPCLPSLPIPVLPAHPLPSCPFPAASPPPKRHTTPVDLLQTPLTQVAHAPIPKLPPKPWLYEPPALPPPILHPDIDSGLRLLAFRGIRFQTITSLKLNLRKFRFPLKRVCWLSFSSRSILEVLVRESDAAFIAHTLKTLLPQVTLLSNYNPITLDIPVETLKKDGALAFRACAAAGHRRVEGYADRAVDHEDDLVANFWYGWRDEVEGGRLMDWDDEVKLIEVFERPKGGWPKGNFQALREACGVVLKEVRRWVDPDPEVKTEDEDEEERAGLGGV